MSGELSEFEGLKPMLPKAGLKPVGERCSSPSDRRTSTISGRIIWSYDDPPRSTGDAIGAPSP